MKAGEIYTFLNGLYPETTACDFDNVGLLVGDYEAEITKALISLDCTLTTIKNAVLNGCQLIITHHPVIFDPLKNVIAGSVVYELIRNNLTVISLHTNLDVAEGGVNVSLCNVIGLEKIESFTAFDGYILREGVTTSPLSAKSFAEQLKKVLGGNVRYTDGGKDIKTVLVCSGSGGKYVTEAISCGFDALVTAEVKHNQFLLASDFGVSVFDAGHFNTEDIVLEPLKEILIDKFKSIDFFTDHTNLINYI